METLSKKQREIERNAAYEALHYACLQSLEILKPDATTGRCEPENVAALIRFNFPVCTITDKKQFKDIASHVADKKETLRPIMQAVYIDPAGYMVASDSHTLKSAQIETKGGVLLPLECHKHIIDSKEPSIISKSDDKIHIKQGDKIKSFAALDGIYPTWRAVVPPPSGKVAIFDKSELMEAVKMAGKNCNQASGLIIFSIDKSRAVISSQDIDINIASNIDIRCTSNVSGDIGIKLCNVIKAIKGVSGNKIKFELTDASRCVMINDTCLIMPLLIHDNYNADFNILDGCTVPQLDIIEPIQPKVKKEPKEPKEKKKTAVQLKREALLQHIAEPQSIQYYTSRDAIEHKRPQRAPNRIYNNARKVLKYLAMVVIIFLLQCSPTSTRPQIVDIQHNKIKNKENQKINVNTCL